MFNFHDIFMVMLENPGICSVLSYLQHLWEGSALPAGLHVRLACRSRLSCCPGCKGHETPDARMGPENLWGASCRCLGVPLLLLVPPLVLLTALPLGKRATVAQTRGREAKLSAPPETSKRANHFCKPSRLVCELLSDTFCGEVAGTPVCGGGGSRHGRRERLCRDEVCRDSDERWGIPIALTASGKAPGWRDDNATRHPRRQGALCSSHHLTPSKATSLAVRPLVVLRDGWNQTLPLALLAIGGRLRSRALVPAVCSLACFGVCMSVCVHRAEVCVCVRGWRIGA